MMNVYNLSERICDLSPAIVERATEHATAELGPIVFRKLTKDEQNEYLHIAYEEFMTILRGATR